MALGCIEAVLKDKAGKERQVRFTGAVLASEEEVRRHVATHVAGHELVRVVSGLPSATVPTGTRKITGDRA